jgi:hypothetical protein
LVYTRPQYRIMAFKTRIRFTEIQLMKNNVPAII